MNLIRFDPDKDFYFHKGMSKRVSATGSSWPHYHGLYEIYFLLEGKCTYFIDNKVYNIESGDIVIIPDGIIHHTRYENIQHSRVLINCNERYIPSFFISDFTQESYLYRNPFITEEVKKLTEKIEQEYKLNDKLSAEILSCHTKALFCLIFRSQASCIPINEESSIIEKAVIHIRENFHRDLTLSTFSDMYSVSSEHFSRMFKKETGLGFSKYLNSLRLQQAELLIKSSPELNITQIANVCGFSDSNYFSKKFKEVTAFLRKKMQTIFKKNTTDSDLP